jgi:hypothetical protein
MALAVEKLKVNYGYDRGGRNGMNASYLNR